MAAMAWVDGIPYSAITLFSSFTTGGRRGGATQDLLGYLGQHTSPAAKPKDRSKANQTSKIINSWIL